MYREPKIGFFGYPESAEKWFKAYLMIAKDYVFV